eukprot:TRINITY_DN4063_c0_g1_i1.p1 TRINITY_DN4063_c0_g1~~TRINITY_DN4063_c0_g1_i1.p1  ORF type:complete len:151 (-),score=32.06 TRINITY_DN4063_c0_g1_i1:94-546(-)
MFSIFRPYHCSTSGIFIKLATTQLRWSTGRVRNAKKKAARLAQKQLQEKLLKKQQNKLELEKRMELNAKSKLENRDKHENMLKMHKDNRAKKWVAFSLFKKQADTPMNKYIEAIAKETGQEPTAQDVKFVTAFVEKLKKKHEKRQSAQKS